MQRPTLDISVRRNRANCQECRYASRGHDKTNKNQNAIMTANKNFKKSIEENWWTQPYCCSHLVTCIIDMTTLTYESWKENTKVPSTSTRKDARHKINYKKSLHANKESLHLGVWLVFASRGAVPKSLFTFPLSDCVYQTAFVGLRLSDFVC